MILAGLSDFITGDLTEWVIDVIDRLGYAGVAFLVLLENVFPPIPSEVVLPAAGIHARDGKSSLALMVLAATVGSVVGAWVLYVAAALIGPVRLRSLVQRHGRWFGLQERDLDNAERWFDERQQLAVLLCRFVPLVRSLVSIPAGFRRMDPLRFTLYTALGSLIWNGTLIVVGYAARQHWGTVQDAMGWAQYLVIALIVAVVVRFLWRRRLRATVAGEAGRGRT